MAVAFIAGTQADGASVTATSVAVSYTVQAGDLLLIGVGASDGATSPSGAPNITSASGNLTRLWSMNEFDHSAAVFYRFVQAGDPTSYTFNTTGGSPVEAMAVRYSGVNTTNPFRNWNVTTNPDGGSGTGTTTSDTFPTLDNVQSNDMVVTHASYARSTKASTITAFTTPSGWTSRQTNTGPVSGSTAFPVYAAWFERLAGTDTPSLSHDTGQCSIFSLALIPADNPVPDPVGGQIDFRNASSAATTTNGSTSLVVNKPTGVVDGDLMILVAGQTRGVASWSAPAGWNRIEVQTGGVNFGISTQYQNITTAIWWKIASGEGASYTVGCTVAGSTPQHYCLAIVAYANARSTTPIELHNGVGTSTLSTTSPAPQALPPGTVTPDNLVILVIVEGGDTTGTYTVTPPGGSWTQRVQVANSKASEFNANITILDQLAASDLPTASSTKTGSWTVHLLSLVGVHIPPLVRRPTPAPNTVAPFRAALR